MSKANLIFYRKRTYDDKAIAEMKLWLVPDSVRGSKQSVKYSLFYGHSDTRLIGYDNEAGKGNHRHYEDREELYLFPRPNG